MSEHESEIVSSQAHGVVPMGLDPSKPLEVGNSIFISLTDLKNHYTKKYEVLLNQHAEKVLKPRDIDHSLTAEDAMNEIKEIVIATIPSLASFLETFEGSVELELQGNGIRLHAKGTHRDDINLTIPREVIQKIRSAVTSHPKYAEWIPLLKRSEEARFSDYRFHIHQAEIDEIGVVVGANLLNRVPIGEYEARMGECFERLLSEREKRWTKEINLPWYLKP